jgi:preprotein translocase subunit SecF
MAVERLSASEWGYKNMEFFKKETRIDFMGIRRYTGAFTAILWIFSISILVYKGLNFGLDFTGGTQIEARFKQEASPVLIKAQLEEEGFQGIRVQQAGSTHDLLIRIANQASTTTSSEQKLSARVKEALLKKHAEVDIRKAEFVGSEVGAELFERGGIAVFISILATMIYIAFRFEYRLAISAAVGLCHDAVLILGVFSLFGFEFDLSALASVLAVLGYSLNDTIVVFDRVRENFRKIRKGNPVDIMNLSINQTLSRTIMTSWMTLLTVLALLFFGGESLFGFSMAFFVGIVIGTFSSIYVSGALALWLGLTRADLLPKAKMELDSRP